MGELGWGRLGGGGGVQVQRTHEVPQLMST